MARDLELDVLFPTLFILEDKRHRGKWPWKRGGGGQWVSSLFIIQEVGNKVYHKWVSQNKEYLSCEQGSGKALPFAEEVFLESITLLLELRNNT